MSDPIDVIASILLISGATFALIAAIGVVRFPDLLNRMHAGTKPQTFGLLLILTGLALQLDSWRAGFLILILIIFQLLTAPVSAHMVGRAAFRTGFVDRDKLYVCETPEDDDEPAPESEEPSEA